MERPQNPFQYPMISNPIKRKLVFASNNPNKLEEIRSIIGEKYQIVSLEEAGVLKEIPEPFDTLEANAREKSTVIHSLTGMDCFSEDTGLEVEALQGAPGVRSARYAGEPANPQKNINKLLLELGNSSNRSARFRTVISLILENHEYQFEGICYGRITEKETGEGGFGYDPIFIPDGSSESFATMTKKEKNQFSHRAKATLQLIEFLEKKWEESK